MKTQKELRKIRLGLGLFIALLVLSGLTAIPLRQEMSFLMNHLYWFAPLLQDWIREVNLAVEKTPEVVLYGMDWLAFGHIVIALFFIPVYLKPIEYRNNLIVGMFACILVFPLAFLMGPVRQIPFFHQLIDCSFGFVGFLFLAYINHLIHKIIINTKPI